MTDDKFTEFKKDLKWLLKKYDASIWIKEEWECDSPNLMVKIKDEEFIFYQAICLCGDCVCDTDYVEDCECKDWE